MGLEILPGYTRLTTILFHSNLFLETQPFLTFLAIMHNISHLSTEWILVFLAGTHSSHHFGFPASNSWTPAVSMASLTTPLSLLFSTWVYGFAAMDESHSQQHCSPCLSSLTYFPACFLHLSLTLSLNKTPFPFPSLPKMVSVGVSQQ